MAIQTPDQRLRVFVSSTMNELAEERVAVKAAIERLRLTPVLFELGARPYPPRDLYLAYVRQSHVFIGIYWEQYGWVAPDQQLSGLEDEYAAAADMPKLVYLKEPAPGRQPRLTDMLERLRSDGLSYRKFSTSEELAVLVADDLAVLLSERFGAAAGPVSRSIAVQHSPPLPAPTSRFIGRTRELAELDALLTDPHARLVTLVGPGGIGKTRLALQAVSRLRGSWFRETRGGPAPPDRELRGSWFRETRGGPAPPDRELRGSWFRETRGGPAPSDRNLAEAYPDGVAVVMLAGVSSPDLVPASIMAALGLPETTGRSPRDVLAGYLRTRRLLLLLDNLEHVIDATPFVAQLLAEAEQLTVLATSREVLRLSGERVVAVPPLTVASDAGPPDALRQSEGVALFVDRARAVDHDLPLDDEQVRTIAEICRQLDGLPLAIELAAARVRLLPPAQILRRLDDRLGILTGGMRDAENRQRTLRDTIRWSYDLLEAPDRALFERLGVFAGGFSLDAAETVCNDDKVPDVFDGLASLVDKSLVRTDGVVGGVARFAMLQTLRDFALERLDAGAAADRIRWAHAEFFYRMVVDNRSAFPDGADPQLVGRHGVDSANIGAAIRWLLDHGQPGRVARMGLALWRVWWSDSLFHEGVRWMEEVLAATPLSPEDRSRANIVLGMLSFGRGDLDRSATALRSAAELSDELGDPRGVATASTPLGVIVASTDHQAGEALIRRSIATFRELGDRWGLAFALLSLGGTLVLDEQFAAAVPPLEEGADIARAAGAQIFLSNALTNLGWAHLGLDDVEAARSVLRTALTAAVAGNNHESMGRALESLAAAELAAGDPKRAALLFGVADGVRRSIAASVWSADRGSHRRTDEALRTLLRADEYDDVTDVGRSMPLDRALHMAGVDASRRLDGDRGIPARLERVADATGTRATDIGSAQDQESFLATVAFVDIVGSTQKVLQLGDRRWGDLLESYLGMARQELQRFGGTEIDTAGDGLFASFPGPARGVACAGAIRDAAGAFGLEVRAGVHTGEAQWINGKIGGVTVHVAARVAAVAAADEVLVSRTVRDLMAGSAVRFEDRGMHALKGLGEEWLLYRADV
jgi:predicted ATPase/class 3 adenylate cyclase